MPPPYHIGVPTAKHGEHHKSISALWELKWKKRVRLVQFDVYVACMMLNVKIGNVGHLSVHGWEVGRP